MFVNNILKELKVSSYTSFSQVHGGKDSSVYQIHLQKGNSYALRILPLEQHEQFIREEKIIHLARKKGIKIPKVLEVKVCEGQSVMLMEWAKGRTVFHELLELPENAFRLGVEFGNTQAKINSITVNRNLTTGSWITPMGEEVDIYQKISEKSCNNQLVHLDYHPLNVLTDGNEITAVIDWVNGALGDYRFDFARTLAILQLEGPKHFKSCPDALSNFEKGWMMGYEEIMGSIEYLPLFCAWAGLRMKRDLAGRIEKKDELYIDHWISKWMEK